MTSTVVDMRVVAGAAATFPDAPYPGLRAFEPYEWPVFFGRERFVETIVARLSAHGVLLVHGDSGAGKSSLIKAGLLPLLAQSSIVEGAPWRSVIARPQRQPVMELANALAAAAPGGAVDPLDVARVLGFGTDAAGELAKLLAVDDRHPLCLVVDQFEELFETAANDGLQATRIAQLLAGALDPGVPGLWIVLTMRSEYLGRCASVPGLAEIVGTHQYLLPRMSRSDLLRAVQEPARLYGGEVSPGFAARLVDCTAGDPDQLPLVQHAMAWLTDARRATLPDGAPWRLDDGDTADPRELLSRHADAVFAEAVAASGLAPASAAATGDRILRALTDTNAEGLAIRRPQTFAELVAVADAPAASVGAFLAPFRATGHTLLTPYGDAPLADGTRVDISHESLLRNWRRIADPVHGLRTREFEDGLRWKVLLQQARESRAADTRQLLAAGYAGNRRRWLDGLNAAWAQRHGGGWDDVVALLDESLRHARRGRNWKRLAVGLIVVAAILGVVAALTWARQQQLARERDEVAADRDDAQSELGVARLELAAAKAKNALNDQDTQRLLYIIRNLEEELAGDSREAIRTQAQQQVQQLREDVLSRQEVSVRVYFHISTEAQRPAAAFVGNRLERVPLPGGSPDVPGIEVQRNAPPTGQLRCFTKEECRGIGPRLLDEINALLVTPKLELVDFSREYEGSTGIRPGHFEVWFAPGNLEPAPPPAAAR